MKMLQNEMGNVRVCCRVRPQNAKELTMATAQRCVSTDKETIEVKVGEAFYYAVGRGQEDLLCQLFAGQ
jgi:hypothetical protein